MTTGEVWYPIELTDTMFQLLFNSYDNRRNIVFKDLKETMVCCGSTLTIKAMHGCRKKKKETMLHLLFNSHNNKWSMISNPETLLHLLFNFYNNRQRHKDHAPAVIHYLPPSDTLSKNSLVNLIDQLPHPFMLVGDFNGHCKVWGCSDTNDRGEIIEDVIAENDLCLLNEKQPTYLHPPTGNFMGATGLPSLTRFACDTRDTREYVFSHAHTQMNENHTRIGKLAEI